MDMVSILITAGLVGAVGLLVGLFLGISGIFLKVPANELESKVRECLPSNNCGGCGYASCDALAKEIALGNAPVNACVVGGDAVAESIAQILGKKAEKSVRRVAHVKCLGSCDVAKRTADYVGVRDCRVAALSPSAGGKGCYYGCIGFGSCVEVCSFNGIKVIDGLARIDADKCRGCGECARVCPKGIIEIVDYKKMPLVSCVSRDRLKDVKNVCGAGCIGCGICEKLCPEKAIKMENNLPSVDLSLCSGCMTCANKCPSKVISSFVLQNEA